MRNVTSVKKSTPSYMKRVVKKSTKTTSGKVKKTKR
jgi:hypothetical protein